MPLTRRRSRLAPAAPSGPRAGLQDSRPSSNTPAIGPWLVPPQTATALRPLPLAAANSQRPVDHRALDPRCESALSPAPACVRLAPRAALVPASQSCLSVPVIAEVRLQASLQLAGSSVQDVALASRIPPVPSETVLDCFGLRLCSLARPFRTCLPARPSCAWLAPCTLGPSVQLAFASAFGLASSGFCSGSAAGSIGYLNSRLAPAVLPLGPFRIQPTIYCVVIDC